MFHMLSIFLIKILPCACAYDSIKDLGILEDFNIFKKAYEKIQEDDFKNINIVPYYELYSFYDTETRKIDYILFAISEQKNIENEEYVKLRWKKETRDTIMGEGNMNYRYRIPNDVSLNFRSIMEKLKEKKQCKYASVIQNSFTVSPYILLDDQVRILIQLIEEYHKSKQKALDNHFKNNAC